MTPDELSSWKQDLARARAAENWASTLESKREDRARARGEILALLQRFLDGTISLEAFRADFDTRTRTDWSTFGFKGMSGAMVLNSLCKHTDSDQQQRLVALLQQLLRLPEGGNSDAIAKLRGFWHGVEELEAEGHFTGKAVGSARIPFFASAFWHVQAPERYPVHYPKARQAFDERDAYESSDDRAEDYARFRDAYLDLCHDLNIDALELECLCSFVVEEEKTPPPPDEGQNDDLPGEGRRTWLFAPGPQAKYWDECLRDGVMLMGDRGEGDLSKFEDSLNAFRTRLYDLRGNKGPQPHNDARACRDFAYRIQPGDLVIVKQGTTKLLGWGIVRGPYTYAPEDHEYPHVRKVDWKPNNEPVPAHKNLNLKTLTNITAHPNFIKKLADAVGAPLDTPEDAAPRRARSTSIRPPGDHGWPLHAGGVDTLDPRASAQQEERHLARPARCRQDLRRTTAGARTDRRKT